MRLSYVVFLFVCLQSFAAHGQYLRAPQPGDIYKDFTYTMRTGSNAQWRVTDPDSAFVSDDPESTNIPAAYLPNPEMSLSVNDLNGAVRAEAVIDLWGGHVGTTGKKVRFNGNSWLTIPELATTPTAGQCYVHQQISVIDIPLSHLVQGTNVFQGTSGGQTCYNFEWGQWGWYSLTVRVYYNSSKPHPTGSITSPATGATIGENPTVTASASGPSGVQQVQFLAYYDGYDSDGDGRFRDYHHHYHRKKRETGQPIRNHVGTKVGAPYSLSWNTGLVPDQAPGGIKLIARIRGNDGTWFVTNEVTDLTLARGANSVQLYKPTNVPRKHWVRGNSEETSNFVISSGHDLSTASAAWLLIRTWNGIDGQREPGETHFTKINNWEAPEYGEDHFFSYDAVPIDVSALRNGSNSITLGSESSHHGVEVLWPGPAVLVRYDDPTAPPSAPSGLTAAASAAGVTLDWTPPAALATFNVLRNQQLIASGVSGSTYLDQSASEFTTYSYTVVAVGLTGQQSSPSSAAVVTTLQDTTAPSLVSATALSTNSLQVRFSEPVTTASGSNTANYRIEGALTPVTLSGASVSGDGLSVVLTTSTIAGGVQYTCVVDGVRDRSSAGNTTLDARHFRFEPGLVHHFPFDDGAGPVASNNGSAGGSAAIDGAEWRSSGAGHALEFSGDDKVDLGNIDMAGSALTIALWMRADELDLFDARLISKASDVRDQDHYWMVSLLGSELRFRLKTASGGTSTLISSGAGITTDQWIHVAAVYNGGQMLIYRNGVIVAQMSKTGAIVSAPSVPAAIGNQPQGGKTLEGRIDEVRMYDRALSTAEVGQLVNSGDSTPPTQPGGLTATATEPSRVQLSWGASGDASGLSHYRIVRSGTVIATTLLRHFEDTTVAPDTQYSYQIVAVDGSGNLSAASAAAVVTTPEPDLTPPSTPAALALDGDVLGGAALVWSAATDNVGVAEYIVLRDGVEVARSATTRHTDTGLVPGAEYSYRIAAVDTSGNISTLSAELLVTLGVVAEGLLAAYGFDEAGGATALDLSGNGFDGTITTGATRNGAGKYDQALLLSGNGGHVDLDRMDIGGDQLTLAMWVRFDDFGIFDARLISKASGVQDQDHYWMLSTYGKRVRFRLKTNQGGTATLISSADTLSPGTWIHLAATYDGAQMRIWQDGAVIATAPKTGAIATAPTVAAWIADNPGGGKNVDGRIDDVRIYSVALNSDQVQAALSTELPDPTVGPPPPPLPAPDVPAALVVSDVTADSVNLAWGTAAGASVYVVFRDGVEILTTSQNQVVDGGLEAVTDYVYQVLAEGATGVRSELSSSVAARTTITMSDRALFASGAAPFGLLDPLTGAHTAVAAPTEPGMLGLAYDPNNDVTFGSFLMGDGSGSLVVLDPTSGAPTLVGPTNESVNRLLTALAYDSTADKLYGLAVVGDQARLFEVNPATGALVVVGDDTAVLAHSGLGLAYDEESDVLYGLRTLLDSTLQVTTVDRSTGAQQLFLALATVVGDAEALTYCREQRRLFTVDLAGPDLVSIDPATSTEVLVGATSSGVLWSAACKEPVPGPLPVDPPPTPDPTPIDGLLLHYGFEGDGAFALDSSANLLDGTLTTGVTRQAGHDGNGVRFTGVGGHIDLQKLDLSGEALTIAMWCRADDFGIFDARLVSKAVGTADQDHYWMVSTFGKRLRFRLKTTVGGTTTLISPTNSLVAGTWHHVAVTYDGTRMRILQDGNVLVSTPKTGSIVTSSAVDAVVGDNPTRGKNFDGTLDDFCIFTRALSPAELQDLAQDGVTVPDDGGAGGGDGDTVAPSTPQGVMAMAVSPTRIEIVWDAATDDVSSDLLYRVIRSGGQNTETEDLNVIDTDLEPDTQYVYRVAAIDEAGNVSTASAPVVVQTLPLGTPVALYAAGSSIPVGTVNRGNGSFLDLGGPDLVVLGLAGDADSSVAYATAIVGGQPVLGTVDLGTGLLTVVGSTTDAGVATEIEGLAFDPNTNTLYGMALHAGSLAELFVVDVTSGQLTSRGTATGVSPADGCGLAYDWMLDTLYALRRSTLGALELVSVNAGSGAQTVIGAISGVSAADGLAYCGDSDMLYTVDRVGVQLVGIDAMTAGVTLFGAGDPDVAGLACAAPVNSDSSLIAAFGFEGSGGTVANAVGPDAPLVSAVRTSLGHDGAALVFDGTDGHVDLSALDINGSGLTIALWVRLDDFGVFDARLISKAVGTSEQDHYWMVSTLGKRLRFRLKTENGGTATLVAPNGSLSAGTWVHVAVTYDGAQMRIYQNGSVLASRAKQGQVTQGPGVAAWVGDNPGGGRPLDGRVDELWIFNRALDASEISDLMVNPVDSE